MFLKTREVEHSEAMHNVVAVISLRVRLLYDTLEQQTRLRLVNPPAPTQRKNESKQTTTYHDEERWKR